MKKPKNFQCDNCKHKFYIPEYTTVIKSDKNIYKEKGSKRIECPKCSLIDISFIAPKQGIPELMGTFHGSFVPEKTLLKDKQKKLNIRSKHHFKNEILPNHPDPQMKPYFEKKYKNTVYRDHEKMK